MEIIRLTNEQLAMLEGIEELLQTEVSAIHIMTNDANDARGLGSMHRQELEEEIRRVAPNGADAYLLGESKFGKMKFNGLASASAKVTYPITFFKLPSYC